MQLVTSGDNIANKNYSRFATSKQSPLPRVIKHPISTSGIPNTICSNLFLRLAWSSNTNNVPGNARGGSHIRGRRGCLSTKPGKWRHEGMPPSDLASPTCSALKLANFVSPPIDARSSTRVDRHILRRAASAQTPTPRTFYTGFT